MKILITGALGHIGSKFIHNIKPGLYEEIIMIDNLSTQRYSSLFNLPSDVNFIFYEDNILKVDLVKYLKNVDVVLHLAAITNAEGSFVIQEEVERVNYEGTKLIAEACLLTGTKLIFLSTTSVYGTQNSLVDEDCGEEELQPQSPYAESKLRAEKYLFKLGIEKGLKFIICRFGTIYGTSIGMRFHTAINKFVWQASLGIPITVWRTALNQKRPYLDLNDAIDCINFIISKNHFNNCIYNVLSENTTVGEIVELIKKYIPYLEVKFVDTRIMNQLSYSVSVEKIKSLGFTFNGAIEKSIKESIELLYNINNRGKIKVEHNE